MCANPFEFGRLLFSADAAGAPASPGGVSISSLAPAATEPATARFRILVIEDHLFLRQGIIALLETEPDLLCCGEADSASEIPRLVSELGPDLVLLDLRLRDGDAFSVIELLKAQTPSLPVLVISQFADERFVTRALRAGARGYVLKEDAPNCIIGAARAVLAGRLFVSPSLVTTLLPLLGAAETPTAPPTPRAEKRKA